MEITEDLKPVAALMLGEVHAAIQRQAEETKRLCEKFAEQVWSGGSQTKLPDNAAWYRSPVGPYASQIVNSYRIAMGQIPNPYHPGVKQFQLFDALTHDYNEGTWISNKKLSSLVYGARVETYLKTSDLEKNGWQLDKQTIDGIVHFKMTRVRIEA